MSMVHASQGRLKPAGAAAAFRAGDRRRRWPRRPCPTPRWTGTHWSPTTTASATRSRRCFRSSSDYNERVREPGGFRLHIAASERDWATSGQARPLPARTRHSTKTAAARRRRLTLTTIRSHDQYNTTIYGLDDRYRGITGRRDVIFIHPQDLAERGLEHGDRIDVEVTRQRRQATRGARLHRRGLRDRRGLGGDVLPGGQCADRAGQPRPALRHAGLQVGAGARARRRHA